MKMPKQKKKQLCNHNIKIKHQYIINVIGLTSL